MPCISNTNYKERTQRLKGANRTGEDIVLVTDYLTYQCESALKDSKNNNIQYTWKSLVDGFFSEILQGNYADYIRYNHAKLLQSIGIPVLNYAPYSVEKSKQGETVDKATLASAISNFHSRVDRGIVIKTLREFPSEKKETKARKAKKPLVEMSDYEILKDALETSLNRLLRRTKATKELHNPVLEINYNFLNMIEEKIKVKDSGGVKITKPLENKED